MVENPIKGSFHRRKVQLSFRQLHLSLGFGELGLGQCHFRLGDDLLLKQLFRVGKLDLSQLDFRFLSVQFRFVQNGQDRKHDISLLHNLPFFHLNLFEVSTLQCADIDVSAGMDLAHEWLGANHVLGHWAGDQDLVLSVMFRFWLISLDLVAPCNGGQRQRQREDWKWRTVLKTDVHDEATHL